MATTVPSFVKTPREVAMSTLNLIQDRKEFGAAGLDTGISTVDKALMPVMPGELVVVMAQTGNFKTGFLRCWYREVVRQLKTQAVGVPREVVAYVSWEMAQEEIGLYDLVEGTGIDVKAAWQGKITDDQLYALAEAAKRREQMPVWLLGHSITGSRGGPIMTMAAIRDALQAMEDRWGTHAAVIFLDHLQEVTNGPGELNVDRRQLVMRNVEGAKQLARDMSAPVILAVQAGRQCGEREFKLPQIGDGQETSRIEQVADKVLALWMPKTTEPLGQLVEGVGVPCTENLLILGIRKQRMGPSGGFLPLHIDFANNRIVPIATQRME
jgi:replicative DNA helicase